MSVLFCLAALMGLGASEASAQQAMGNAQEDAAEKPSVWYLNAALGLSSILEEDAPDTGVAGGIAVGANSTL